jgi:iron complex transport system permease protein
MKVWLALLLVLGAAIVVAACAGHDWASPIDLVRALAGDTDMRSRLLLEWRMPRVLAAALVGTLLGIGGAIFQGVFRNPLAEPYLLGSAGGAALGATVALLVLLGASTAPPSRAGVRGAWAQPSFIAVRAWGAVDAAGILLAGVAVAAILGALRSFFTLALSDETVSLQVVLSWVLGGADADLTTLTSWQDIGRVPGLATLLSRGLDVLGPGRRWRSASASTLGDLAFARCLIVVAAAVAFGGLVAAGLAAPHIARWLVGPIHRPCCRRRRWWARPSSPRRCDQRSALPPGNSARPVTAVAGGPFFILLLARKLCA